MGLGPDPTWHPQRRTLAGRGGAARLHSSDINTRKTRRIQRLLQPIRPSSQLSSERAQRTPTFIVHRHSIRYISRVLLRTWLPWRPSSFANGRGFNSFPPPFRPSCSNWSANSSRRFRFSISDIHAYTNVVGLVLQCFSEWIAMPRAYA